jgi:FlaA1/EpsC-like NDP-sugar epimerase
MVSVPGLQTVVSKTRKQIMMQRMLRLMSFLRKLSFSRRAAMWITQAAIFATAGLASFILRFEFAVPDHYLIHDLQAVPVWVSVKMLAFWLLQLDRGWWRYVSVPDVVRIVFGNIVGSVGSIVVIHSMMPDFPRSLYLLDLLLSIQGTAGVRIAVRVLRDHIVQRRADPNSKRILIYGAGTAGMMLLREIGTNPRLKYLVCGFIDDNPKKKGMYVQRLPVFGAGPDVRRLAQKHKIQEILIAMPSVTGPRMTEILQHCQGSGLAFKTVPGLADLIEGSALTAQIREVAVEDLLGRKPVRLDQSAIEARLRGKVVVVTGAAGSIGSELCRQIARFSPAAIVAYEVGETALFHLERELRASYPKVRFHGEIGSIQNFRRLMDVFSQHRPSILYHAAAYKHVPLMEAHMFEAVENNVLGTYNTALAAAECGIEDFVMISSDKAVNPTNIMGTTKRVAELVINSFQDSGPKYVSVRFGNVLGSNGSVVPIFKQQIAAGGPVTVTHPEMRRYFMTIPEAAQLVLQASTMGHGGEIFVLDMGEPVKIVELARNLILLSGLRPEVDVKIEFTGTRPGEKLYEEVSKLEEDTVPTYHEKIRIFAGSPVFERHMRAQVDVLRDMCAYRDARGLLLTLKHLVPDYNPSAGILHECMGEPEAVQVGSSDRAIELPGNMGELPSQRRRPAVGT